MDKFICRCLNSRSLQGQSIDYLWDLFQALGFLKPSPPAWEDTGSQRGRYRCTPPRWGGITELWVYLLPLSFCGFLDKSSGTWLTCLYIRSLKMSSDILAAHHLLKVSFGPMSDLSVICACPGHLTEPNWLLLSMFWQLNQSPRILPQPSSNDVSSDHCSPQTQSITCWNHPALPWLLF